MAKSPTITPPNRAVHTLTPPEEFYDFTRARFVCNEHDELARRRVFFDVNELCKIAANAVGARFCSSIGKLPDGLYNKAFLLTMDNGIKTIAKVPNPNAGDPHLTTASEVATMKFAKEILHTPLPQVYAWSTRAESTPVGSKYIIMEHVTGIGLEHVWNQRSIEKQFEVVKQLVNYQKAWSSLTFQTFGSLYLAEQVKGHTVRYRKADGIWVTDDRFVIGPTVGREWFDDSRGDVALDRGPWHTLNDYHTAIGHRERLCVESLATLPPSPVSLSGPGLYRRNRAIMVSAMDAYLKLLQGLLPTDTALGAPCLWHADLHAGNIFVDSKDTTRIVGIIDWQSTEIRPLYFCAQQPPLLEYNGPKLDGLARPSLPDNFERLSSADQKTAQSLYLHQSLCSLYRTLVHRQLPIVHQCFEFQATPNFNLLLLARNLLVDGEGPYLSQVIDLESQWASISTKPDMQWPLWFSESEKLAIDAHAMANVKSMGVLRSIRDTLGDLYPEKGLVPNDQYYEAMDALHQIQDQVVSEFAGSSEDEKEWRTSWPLNT